MATVGLYNPLDHVEGDVQPLLRLLLLFLLGMLQGITIFLTHLIPNLPLVLPLLDEALLLPEPSAELVEGGDLVLTGVDLREV